MRVTKVVGKLHQEVLEEQARLRSAYIHRHARISQRSCRLFLQAWIRWKMGYMLGWTELVGRAPVQRVARRSTNRQLEAGEGNQPVGRAPVHRQPPCPLYCKQRARRKSSTGRGGASSRGGRSPADESLASREQEVFFENRARPQLRRRLAEGEAHRRELEERRARRESQEIERVHGE